MDTSIAHQAAEERSLWYFTFGTNHKHRASGENLGQAYVTFTGSWAEARARMVAAFGDKWSHQYATSEQAGVGRWGLRQVLPPAECGCPVRFAPDIRGDAEDTLVEHHDGCAGERSGSKVWACPRDCGYHIVDGPVADGEVPTDVLISEHMEQHARIDRHADCDNAYKNVVCDRCGKHYECTPQSDYYCTPEGDHCCEACLIGNRKLVTIPVDVEQPSMVETAEVAEPSQAELIARDLRTIADRFDSLAGTTLEQRLYLSMNVQPSGGRVGPFDKESVVDAVGLAVLGVAGKPQRMTSGTWHHDASGRVGEISFAVFGGCPDPNGTPEEQEIRRLRAELEAANAKLAERGDATTEMGLGR